MDAEYAPPPNYCVKTAHLHYIQKRKKHLVTDVHSTCGITV